jgi:ABC-type nitrate/sulfonate/bicarbonate transport system permease component
MKQHALARHLGDRTYAVGAVAALIAVWQTISMTGMIPPYMLPGPAKVARAFISDFPLLMGHLGHTLLEAGLGLGVSVAAATALAVVMDANRFLKRAVTPLLLLTQTMPVIAIAPLLVLWLGYGMTPKIALIFLTCFFPLTVALLGGFAGSDGDAIRLLRSMGARRWEIYYYIKFPGALPSFFSGLKISASSAIIGAVIAEWLGGSAGLGVYMTRVRKSYSFDKMFAVILLVSALSLLLMRGVSALEKAAMPYKAERNV